MNTVYDIAVVGSGFAGSLFAMIARRLGRSVLMLERGAHPRVVIGESSTPLSNLILEDLAARYDLPAIKPLTKWGSWQRSYPQLACGLKRGFTFYHHDSSQPYSAINDQLLVAASPHDDIADTHWYRADLDQFLVQEAQRLGVEYVDEVSLDRFVDGSRDVLLEGTRHGAGASYRARLVVDATGPRGFLHRALGLSDVGLPGYPHTRALYSHFSGVKRLEHSPAHASTENPPYPIDDAAVHHVFDEGWIWILHFNNGVTSAGVAATDGCAGHLRLAEGEAAWRRVLAKIPVLEDQFANAKREMPFTYMSRVPFRSSSFAGKRWAMLPSAAGFVDPLLSTGFTLTLLGVSRLAKCLEESWESPDLSQRIGAYAPTTEQELLATGRLVAALFANMSNFPVFRALTLLYFAAASFSETARRLGKSDLVSSFLLHDHPGFGEECRRLLCRVASGAPPTDSDTIVREVHRIIEPIDVAGLCKNQPNSCYPVRADDLLNAAWKLGATRDEIVRLLDRAGFYPVQA